MVASSVTHSIEIKSVLARKLPVHFYKPELFIIPATVVPAAACETRGLSTQGAGAPDFRGAVRAAIHKAPGYYSPRQREIVAALLIVDPEIPACLLPLRAVRRNAPPPGTMMREKMGKFVTQCAVNFLSAKCGQP